MSASLVPASMVIYRAAGISSTAAVLALALAAAHDHEGRAAPTAHRG
jgi:hypothetical protein